eukprot:404929-Prymnesium_polylepis.1
MRRGSAQVMNAVVAAVDPVKRAMCGSSMSVASLSSNSSTWTRGLKDAAGLKDRGLLSAADEAALKAAYEHIREPSDDDEHHHKTQAELLEKSVLFRLPGICVLVLSLLRIVLICAAALVFFSVGVLLILLSLILPPVWMIKSLAPRLRELQLRIMQPFITVHNDK